VSPNEVLRAAGAAGLVAIAVAAAAPRLAAGEALTLREAIERALATSPTLEAAEQERVRAGAGVDRARAAFLPRLDGSYGYARSDQPVFAFGSKLNQGRFAQSDFEVPRLNGPEPLDNFRAAVTLYQPLYTGGRASLGLGRARLDARIATLDGTRTRQRVIFQVARAYLALRLAQERLDAIGASVRAAEANRALAETRVRAGLAVESDRLSADVRLARLREESLTAQSQLGVARAALNDAMGVSLDEPSEASDPLAERSSPGPALPVADALAQRPDVQASRLEEDARERDLRAVRAAFLPSVGIEGTYEVNTAHPFSDGQGSWSVMTVLRWNVFNGGADRARIREAEAALARARALSARLRSHAELEAREAEAQLASAQGRIDVATRAIAHAEETLRVVRIRYENGLTTIVELLTAEAATTESRLRRAQALFDHNVAVAARELAFGQLRPESLW
jgi:outer membrane protein TolC